MATEAFRSAIHADLEAWRLGFDPEIPAFYENGPLPSESEIGSIWIDCMIRYYSANFVSMGVRPMGRHSGTILTNVYIRSSEGSARPDQVIDSIKERLRGRRIGGGLLRMPHRAASSDFHGWYKAGLLTPFTLDDK